MRRMMKKITKSVISVSLASMMVFASGCGNNASSTAIEISTLDTTVEDIHVNLTEGERYMNPITDEQQPYRANSIEAQLLSGVAEDQVHDDKSGTGDPYILRYNGKYYLYVSTDDWFCSYRVWESLDLINYTYLGEYDLLDIDGKRTEGDTAAGQGFDLECPWAPEVHYWNGEFYMYTSPHASGQTTGNYPGKATTPAQLMADIDKVLSLDGGKKKLNLHACYAIFDEGEWADRDALEPKHFAKWVKFAKERGMGIDFNPTFFSHPMVKDNLTLSSPDEETRAYWVRHGHEMEIWHSTSR